MKFLYAAVLLLVLLIASQGIAGENCSMLGAKCRDACGQGEEAQAGAFEDCGEKQDCCLARDPNAGRVKCCVYSFSAGNYGPNNCGSPRDSVCLKGSGSTAACEKLAMCRDKSQ